MVAIASAGTVIIIDAEFLAVTVELSQFTIQKYLSIVAVAQALYQTGRLRDLCQNSQWFSAFCIYVLNE